LLGSSSAAAASIHHESHRCLQLSAGAVGGGLGGGRWEAYFEQGVEA
jgi:hypothetical protein